MGVEVIKWREGTLSIVDQTRLPNQLQYIDLKTVDAVVEAIRQLRVRGAPAIGVCAAYGILVGIRENGSADSAAVIQAVEQTAARLAATRPTAVNLFWALDRMRAVTARAEAAAMSKEALYRALEAEAAAIDQENVALCEAIGRTGAPLVTENAGVLTHCNAGALATAGAGTALAPLFRASEEGRRFTVYADETRPLLQGARLTAWELVQAGVEVVVICDNMAAQVMREGKIDLAIVGADRIAANGDTANKIGTYGVAVLARAHDIPFYVAAPYSTFDPKVATGDDIPIELRPAEEVSQGFGPRTAPALAAIYNPAFDVTPARLITGFITEKGIIAPPFREGIAALRETGPND